MTDPRYAAFTAGYFEMMQTLAAVCITWGFFHASLHARQVIAAIILIAAVAMVHTSNNRSSLTAPKAVRLDRSEIAVAAPLRASN